MDDIECVICKSESANPVIKFTEESLKKCKDVLEYRQNKEYRRKSKYVDIKLPSEVDQTLGYHYSCYKCFTSIPKSKNDHDDDNSAVER